MRSKLVCWVVIGIIFQFVSFLFGGGGKGDWVERFKREREKNARGDPPGVVVRGVES